MLRQLVQLKGNVLVFHLHLHKVLINVLDLLLIHGVRLLLLEEVVVLLISLRAFWHPFNRWHFTVAALGVLLPSPITLILEKGFRQVVPILAFLVSLVWLICKCISAVLRLMLSVLRQPTRVWWSLLWKPRDATTFLLLRCWRELPCGFRARLSHPILFATLIWDLPVDLIYVVLLVL